MTYYVILFATHAETYPRSRLGKVPGKGMAIGGVGGGRRRLPDPMPPRVGRGGFGRRRSM